MKMSYFILRARVLVCTLISKSHNHLWNRNIGEFKRKCVFVANSNVAVPISLEPDVIDFRYLYKL